MLKETLKVRLDHNRPMTSITLRIPVDVVDSMKAIAPKKGFSGYQTLLKTYISEGLRKDEAQQALMQSENFMAALKQQGISDEVIASALQACGKSQEAART